MKPCTQCGASNPDEAKFCRQCGTPFALAAPTTPAYTAPNPASITTPVTIDSVKPPVNSVTVSADQSQPAAQPIGQPYHNSAPTQPLNTAPNVAANTAPSTAPNTAQPNPQYVQPNPQYSQTNPQYAAPNPQFTSSNTAPAEAKPLITPEMKAEARAFGDWFKTFFLRPSEVGGGKPWYALAVIFATTLLSALAATTVIAHGGGSLLSMIPFVDSYYVSSAVDEAALFMFVVLWIMFSLYVYGTLLVLRLVRSVMGDPVTFRTLHDDFAHRLAPWLGLFALAAVFAIIHVDTLAIVLWSLAVVTQSMWMMVLVYEGDSRRQLDSQWVKFLCVLLQIVLSVIVFMILVTVMSTIIGAVIAGMMHNVLY